jgi:hypothetical protein
MGINGTCAAKYPVGATLMTGLSIFCHFVIATDFLSWLPFA